MQDVSIRKGLNERPEKGKKLGIFAAERFDSSQYLIFSPFSQEEELRLSGEYKYSHLSEDLHVEIQTFAPPAEAHARIAYALAEVRRFLVPVSELSLVPLSSTHFQEGVA